MKCPVCNVRTAIQMASGFGLYCGHASCTQSVLIALAAQDRAWRQAEEANRPKHNGIGASLGDQCRNDRLP